MESSREKKIITLYVYNIPKFMHWKGLWVLFGYHGKVVVAFIPSRENIRGRRYGFVRFEEIREAQRAITRLNGFFLLGNRIWVKIARCNRSRKIWRKNKGQGEQEQRAVRQQNKEEIGSKSIMEEESNESSSKEVMVGMKKL